MAWDNVAGLVISDIGTRAGTGDWFSWDGGLFGAGARARDAAIAAAEGQALAAENLLAASGLFAENLWNNAGEYEENVEESIQEGREAIQFAYLNSKGIIKRLPTIKKLMPEAKEISRDDFDFRTELKRENLDFILGSSKQDLRTSQSLNSSLAALDSTGFSSNLQKILRSDLLDLKAATVGEPVGTFANLSAKNMFAFANQGLSNALAIGDFFAREGTVDPISPYKISLDLYGIKENQAKMRIDNEWRRSDSTVNLMGMRIGAMGNLLNAQNLASQAEYSGQENYWNTMASLAGAQEYAQMTAGNAGLAAASSAWGMISDGMSSYMNMGSTQQSAQNSQQMTQYYNNQKYTPSGGEGGGAGSGGGMGFF